MGAPIQLTAADVDMQLTHAGSGLGSGAGSQSNMLPPPKTEFNVQNIFQPSSAPFNYINATPGQNNNQQPVGVPNAGAALQNNKNVQIQAANGAVGHQ